MPADQTDREWLPELEAAAPGIAAADQGADAVALMGLSAARVHGAIPRALGVAVVAAAGHRNELALLDRDARPDLGRLPDEARAAAKALLPRADQTTLRELATAQRRGAVLDRLLAPARGGPRRVLRRHVPAPHVHPGRPPVRGHRPDRRQRTAAGGRTGGLLPGARRAPRVPGPSHRTKPVGVRRGRPRGISRHCPGCRELDIVRENDFVCVFCGGSLPAEWNVDGHS